jgi:hypothetical protein
MWVYLLKKKFNAFVEFKIFKVALEKEFGRCIKIL